MKKFLKEWVPYLLIIIIIILIRSYIVTPVIVNGDSMYNTLEDKDVLLLSKIQYQINEIKRFDIVVINDNTSNEYIIKRIIGLPGDNIEYKDDILYINGKKYKKRFTKDITDDFTLEDICNINKISCNGKIPKNMYLVLGDNRDVSADSRVKGLIDKKQIIGKSIARIWPINKIKKI